MESLIKMERQTINNLTKTEKIKKKKKIFFYNQNFQKINKKKKYQN